MEEELRCSHCRRFFEDPILLACGHSYCRCCALKVRYYFPVPVSIFRSQVSQCPSATRPCTPGSGSGSGSGHLGSFALSVAGSPLSPQPSSSSGSY